MSTKEFVMREMHKLSQAPEAIDPASVGVKLIGPAKWKDGTPVTLVWIQVAETGAWKGHGAGPFEMTSKTFDEIVTNYKARGLPIPWDQEHASEADATSGTIPITGAPAQGWIHRLDNRGPAGLFALTEWLDVARDGIKAGQFAWCSPAVRFGARDGVTGKEVGARLTSVAIVSQPFLTGLEQLVAAKDHAANALPRDHAAKVKAALSDHATASDPACCALHAATAGLLACYTDDDEGGAEMTDTAQSTAIVLAGQASRLTLLMRERDATIGAQTEEIRTLREWKSAQEERDLQAEVDVAHKTWRDKLAYGDQDRALLLSWARSDRASFRARHPVIEQEHRHLLLTLTPPESKPKPEADESQTVSVTRRMKAEDISFAEAQIRAAAGIPSQVQR